MNYVLFHVKKKRATGGYFQLYTLLFLFTSLIIFSCFFITGRTFISHVDGELQHYPALIYYAKYLRTIFRGLLFEHRLVIPAWDFSIGMGSDILSTLHYYVIGDPFAAFCIFVPTRYMYLYYDFMILLRLYLAGIAFSCLCFKTGHRNHYGILAGSMTYVFSYWALYLTITHPYFLNPMLYMPMLLIGIEKILKKERPYFFIFSVFISAISNFYFFYMLVFVTVIYTIVRLLIAYRGFKSTLLAVLKIGFNAALGVLMASFIFLPVLYAFMSDARTDSQNAVHLFYPLSYYSSLPARFLSFSSSYYMYMGFAAPVLPATLLMFYKKRNFKVLKILFLICILIMLFPFLGYALNGFSYVSNRWSWAFALLCSYILSAIWQSLMNLKKTEFTFLMLSILCYSALCIVLDYSRNVIVLTAVILTLFFLLFIMKNKKKTINVPPFVLQKPALLIVLFSVLLNGFWVYSPKGNNAISRVNDVSEIKEQYPNTDATAVKQVSEAENTDGFWRYSGGNSLHENAGFKSGLSSSQFYWSLSNPYIVQFRKEMEFNDDFAFRYKGFDSSAALNALSAVLYYVVYAEETIPVPYGFTYIDAINIKNASLQKAISSMKDELHIYELTAEQTHALEIECSDYYRVYRNDFALPLAYAYDKTLSENAWNSLSAPEKQEAMLQSVFLKNNLSNEGCQKENLNLSSQTIDYTMAADNSGVTIQDNSFIVTSEGSSVTLEFDGLTNSETYFSIKNLRFTGRPEYDLYFGDENADPTNFYGKTLWDTKSRAEKYSLRKEKLYWTPPSSTDIILKSSAGVGRTLTYATEEYEWYHNCHDFTINMGWANDKITSLTITFSDIGTYSFDSIHITCHPMDNYGAEISKLREHTLENIIIEPNSVKGTITLDSPQILCFSIPYSIGWKAKVDGKEVSLYQANTMYMGIPLDAGMHDISLEYSTPFLKEAVYVSCISLFLFAGYVIFTERKKRIIKG